MKGGSNASLVVEPALPAPVAAPQAARGSAPPPGSPAASPRSSRVALPSPPASPAWAKQTKEVSSNVCSEFKVNVSQHACPGLLARASALRH